MKGKLDGALLEFQKNLEAGVALGDRGDTSSLVSAMNGMSVEDMQKSLSSAECSREDDDLGQLVLEVMIIHWNYDSFNYVVVF